MLLLRLLGEERLERVAEQVRRDIQVPDGFHLAGKLLQRESEEHASRGVAPHFDAPSLSVRPGIGQEAECFRLPLGLDLGDFRGRLGGDALRLCLGRDPFAVGGGLGLGLAQEIGALLRNQAFLASGQLDLR